MHICVLLYVAVFWYYPALIPWVIVSKNLLRGITWTKKKKTELLFPPCDCFGQIKPLLLIRKTWGCMREDSHWSPSSSHAPPCSISQQTYCNTTQNQKTNQLPTHTHLSIRPGCFKTSNNQAKFRRKKKELNAPFSHRHRSRISFHPFFE